MFVMLAVRFVTVDVRLVTLEKEAKVLATTSIKPLAFSVKLGARPRMVAENPLALILFCESIVMSVPACNVQLIIPFWQSMKV